jgi:tRNA U34 5-carboxymethylaminomethyl modifying GTPase MnmE/TrmE
LRESGDAIEQAGATRAQALIAAADLCIWIVDGSTAPAFPETVPERCLYVTNKIDLPAGWNWETMPDALRVSAKTSAGLTDLCQRIVDRLVPTVPEPGEAVPYTEEMCVAIESIAAALRGDRDVEAALAALEAQSRQAHAGSRVR